MCWVIDDTKYARVGKRKNGSNYKYEVGIFHLSPECALLRAKQFFMQCIESLYSPVLLLLYFHFYNIGLSNHVASFRRVFRTYWTGKAIVPY